MSGDSGPNSSRHLSSFYIPYESQSAKHVIRFIIIYEATRVIDFRGLYNNKTKLFVGGK